MNSEAIDLKHLVFRNTSKYHQTGCVFVPLRVQQITCPLFDLSTTAADCVPPSSAVGRV
jgi:hypothetical protein